jgi:flagellar biosynthetic protein FliR
MASSTATFDLGQSWLTSTVLLATRLGGLLLMTPPIGVKAIPPVVRVALVVGLAAMLAAALPPALQPHIDNVGDLLAATCGELALGLTMALGMAFAFAAFAAGARLLDVQIGFGIGQIFDPVTQQQLPVLSGVVAQLAAVLFFVSDAHHAVLRGVSASIERFPPGAAWPLEAAFGPVLHQAAGMFSLGFAVVAPVVFCLALIDLGLGVLARNLPQMNMFVLGVPVKVVAGLAALSIWIAASAGVVNRINTSIFSGWEAMFR